MNKGGEKYFVCGPMIYADFQFISFVLSTGAESTGVEHSGCPTGATGTLSMLGQVRGVVNCEEKRKRGPGENIL